MKILVLTSLDATNFYMCNTILELHKRGNELNIFGSSLEEHNVWMFGILKKEIHPIGELKDQDVEECDFIIAANEMLWHVITARKYTISINMASCTGAHLSEGGDIMFLPNYIRYNGWKERSFSIVAGNPKILSQGTTVAPIGHNILFIDSGHYPFSEEGKSVLAKMLIDICMKLPDYHVVVKPRFLKKDADVTHRNHLFLEDFILRENNGTFPPNMDYLSEHKEMEELIDDSEVVLCLYTTAFYDVLDKGKPVIVIKGLPSEDSIDLNNEYYWNIVEELYSESGCVVDYRDVLEYLPAGIKSNPGFVEKVSPRFYNQPSYICIADAIEYLYDEIIIRNKFLKIKDTDIYNYRDLIEEDLTVGWDDIIKNRYINEIQYIATRYCDAVGVDKKLYLGDETWIKVMADSEVDAGNTCETLRSKVYDRLFNTTIKHRDSMLDTAIHESYMLEAMYHVDGSVFDNEIALAHEQTMRSYCYFKALRLFALNRYYDSISYLDKYLSYMNVIPFEQLCTDAGWCLKNANVLRASFELSLFSKFERGCRAVLYGFGRFGQSFYKQVIEHSLCSFVAIVDSNAENINDDMVQSPQVLQNIEYDCIIIAVKDEASRERITDFLVGEYGINRELIIV